MKYCNTCGSQLEDDAVFCGECGTPVTKAETQLPVQTPVNSAPVVEKVVYVERPTTNIPEEYQPMSPWGFWGCSLLFSVPIVGFIFLIIFSINGSNLSRRNFARSYWIPVVICFVIVMILVIVGIATGAGLGIFEDIADEIF